ncbi:MAG: toprim domain-containing protein, partial [Pseudomonadota bacterium]
MVCAVSPLDAPDRPHAVQCLWLASDGRKANLTTPKKSLGAVAGGGVVLAPFHSRLIIAEGVETALSADEAWGTSAVATLGTANMEAVQIPAFVSDVLIAFDLDANRAGEKAARSLAMRLHAEGRAVTL